MGLIRVQLSVQHCQYVVRFPRVTVGRDVSAGMGGTTARPRHPSRTDARYITGQSTTCTVSEIPAPPQ